MEGVLLRKKQTATIIIFVITVTCIALYFNWTEFYEGYSYFNFNLFISIIFLSAWILFSFYWGIIEKEKYKKFIIVYWGISSIASIVIWILCNTKLTNLFISPFYVWYGGTLSKFRHIIVHYKLMDSFLLLFYIWYGGPLYGFRYILKIDRPSLMLITSLLGMLSCFIGYWFGCLVSKLKKS